MKVTKMHALGNNYVYVSEFEEVLSDVDLPALAEAVSDVRRGIGSDGLILIRRSNKADVRMQVFNADGSEAENCGNGLRCVAKFAYEHGYVQKEQFLIEVRGGLVEAHVHRPEFGEVRRVTIDMGAPRLGTAAVGYAGQGLRNEQEDVSIRTTQGTYKGTLVCMGNPHFVSFVDDALVVPVDEVGPQIERHPDFPNRINVEFVTPRNRHELDFRVWERGSGITYACGTGACASVAAGIRKGVVDNQVTVHLLGGDLEIEYRDDRVWMTGEAVTVLSGEYILPANFGR